MGLPTHYSTVLGLELIYEVSKIIFHTAFFFFMVLYIADCIGVPQQHFLQIAKELRMTGVTKQPAVSFWKETYRTKATDLLVGESRVMFR